MDVLITNYYSNKNKGDAAILISLIAQLRKVYPNVNVSISSMAGLEESKIDKEVLLLTSIFYEAIYKHSNSILRFIKTCYLISNTLIWALLNKFIGINIYFLFSAELNTFLLKLKKSNLVIGTGGGYLVGDKSINTYITLILHLHVFLLAKILRKPVCLYSQSIGSFKSKLQEWYVSYILNFTQAILVREDISMSYLKKIGVKPNIIYRSVDAAFLFKSTIKFSSLMLFNRFGINTKKTVVMITVKRLKEPIYSYYLKSIQLFIEKLLLNNNIQVVLVPQCTSTLHNDDDSKVINTLINKLKSPDKVIVIKEELSTYEIKSLYESANYLVATRMHSAILALTGYVPTIAIAYENKTIGIMKDLNLSEWVIPINQVSLDTLDYTFNNLVNGRKLYREVLKKSLPAYLHKAKNNIEVLRTVFSSPKSSLNHTNA